jgi:exodeoxyribonuclease VIII
MTNEKGPPIPKVGVHRGVPAPTYHTWDAASNSRLGKLKRSPAHLRASLDEAPGKESPALKIGRAVHAAVLEPEVFAADWVAGPPGDRRTKEVRYVWEELEAKFGAEYVLKPADYAMACRVRDSVWARRSARALLDGDGDLELSMVWQDPDTGLLCKGRYDRLSPLLAGGTIVDLKTTQDASLFAFERSIFNFGYHRQAAMYLDAAEALGVAVEHYTIIAVEKAPPYEVAVYRLTEGAVDGGREELKPLLATYAECQSTGHWPGYADRVRDISLPPWAWNRITEELAAEGAQHG